MGGVDVRRGRAWRACCDGGGGRNGRRRVCGSRCRSGDAAGCSDRERRRRTAAGVSRGWRSARECRGVLERLELRLAERVVVGLMRTRVRLQTPRSARSWATVFEVIELPRSACKVSWPRPTLFGGGRLRRFSRRATADSRAATQPVDDVAGVDVEDRVEVEPVPLVRAGEPGDVPRPHLVRGGRDELGLDVGGVSSIASTFSDLVACAQDAIHGRHRREIAAFVEQRGPHLGGCLVAEAFVVERGDDLGVLFVAERSRRSGPWRGRAERSAICDVAVVGAGSGRTLAGSDRPMIGASSSTAASRITLDVSSVSALFESSSKNARTLFPGPRSRAAPWRVAPAASGSRDATGRLRRSWDRHAGRGAAAVFEEPFSSLALPVRDHRRVDAFAAQDRRAFRGIRRGPVVPGPRSLKPASKDRRLARSVRSGSGLLTRPPLLATVRFAE